MGSVMVLRTRFWDELTTEEFRALPPGTVAILPVAATEQHGPHLPLATDAVINRGILERALTLLPPALPALALPAQAVGHSPEHTGFPGTLTLRAETARTAWTELAEGVQVAGVRRLVLFNSHGGNPPLLDLMAVDLRVRLGLLVVPASWTRFGYPPGLFPPEELEFGIHGGAVETSLMLHLRPDLVRRDRIADFPSAARAVAAGNRVLRSHGRIGTGWMTADLNPAGAVGDARLATAEAGRALLEHAAAALATLVGEVHRLPLPWDGETPGR